MGVRGDHPHPEGGAGRAGLGARPLRTRVFVVEIAGVLILGLDVLHVHGAYVDLRRRVLRLGLEGPLESVDCQDRHPRRSVRDEDASSVCKTARMAEDRAERKHLDDGDVGPLQEVETGRRPQ
jgi:hypothetical protein